MKASLLAHAGGTAEAGERGGASPALLEDPDLACRQGEVLWRRCPFPILCSRTTSGGIAGAWRAGGRGLEKARLENHLETRGLGEIVARYARTAQR